MLPRICCGLFLACALAAQDLPLVSNVEYQPLAAQVSRLLDAMDMLGEPLPPKDAAELKRLLTPPQDASGRWPPSRTFSTNIV